MSYHVSVLSPLNNKYGFLLFTCEFVIMFRAFLFPEDQQIKLGFQAVTSKANVTASKVRCVFILKAIFMIVWYCLKIVKYYLKQQTYLYFTLAGSVLPSFQHFSPFWNFTPRPAGGSAPPLQVCHSDSEYFIIDTFFTLRPIVKRIRVSNCLG